MIRAIRDWREYRRLRAQWTYDADAETWSRDGWVIRRVIGQPATDAHDGWAGYQISRHGRPVGGIHDTLRQSIEAVDRAEKSAPISMLRSARASIPDRLDDDDADAHDRFWRGRK